MEKASANNNFHYNKSLREKARMLRNHSTKAEILLWDSLLKNRFLEFQFLRQRPVLWYIADFICLELMLVIEVDGDTHLIEEVQQKDIRKQADLEAIGFSVLRFQDWEIFSRRDEVLEDLKAWINTNFPGKLQAKLPLSHLQSQTQRPSPFEGGRGDEHVPRVD